MRSRRVELGLTVQPGVDRVQFFGQAASDVEPPVADEKRLRKLRPIRTEKGRLPTVDVAVVPHLAPGVHIGEESRVLLFVTVEFGVGHRS